jgi:hypothetical protein|tara:strand:+ start:4098 stop:4718 length:621 start_codon:yes stop_codon:yes gene_type:complete
MNNWKKTQTVLDMLELKYTTLSKDHYKWFKDACQRAKNKKILKNHTLIGHIKEEYAMERPPKKIIKMLLKLIDNKFSTYLRKITMLTEDLPFDLDQIWCNFQKKHEFNPPHDHSGVFTFVVFIKIPYLLSEENKCFKTGEGVGYTSKFTFHSINRFGRIQLWPLEVDKSFEGKIIFFPATQIHEVFPFYTSNDYRITVSGNIKLRV